VRRETRPLDRLIWFEVGEDVRCGGPRGGLGFSFNHGRSRREAVRGFGLSRETIGNMCRSRFRLATCDEVEVGSTVADDRRDPRC
jgi:hypothetical protein